MQEYLIYLQIFHNEQDKREKNVKLSNVPDLLPINNCIASLILTPKEKKRHQKSNYDEKQATLKIARETYISGFAREW